ncbi:endonuclease/exonuclease/phosphatase [Patescibacteria group bacterium]|nr:endonuclease/exonuclease/phosphatase [Patescibacteria group bacterium]
MIKQKKDLKNNFSIFCWNIANPSIERASRQVDWLSKRNEDIFVLTETKNSKGCAFIEEYFKKNNYSVIFTKPDGKEYGSMVISKHQLEPIGFYNLNDNLKPRIVSVKVFLSNKFVEIIGAYIPSRDKSFDKVQRKKQFIENLRKSFQLYNNNSNRIFCGDFNILEPNHTPHYPFFENWEYGFYNSLISYGLFDSFRHLNPKKQDYSWVGRTGDGYRYDYCFVSKDLLPSIKECYYLHNPRKERLSDHSAIITKLSL